MTKVLSIIVTECNVSGLPWKRHILGKMQWGSEYGVIVELFLDFAPDLAAIS